MAEGEGFQITVSKKGRESTVYSALLGEKKF